MSEEHLHVWVHTRGEKWDYRWITNQATEPPFPGGATGVLKQIAPTQPSVPGAVLVWYDSKTLAIAAGSYTDRRDQHSRRIQQHVVISMVHPDPPSASGITGMVRAITGIDITLLIDRLTIKDISITELADQVVLLASQNRESEETQLRDESLVAPEIIQSLVDNCSLLCVEPNLSFSELWNRVYKFDQLIRERFYVGSGIADPLAIIGRAGIVSTSKPLLPWGATAGQCILFSSDGRPTAKDYGDLPKTAIQGKECTDVPSFSRERHRGWRILPAKGSFGKRT